MAVVSPPERSVLLKLLDEWPLGLALLFGCISLSTVLVWSSVSRELAAGERLAEELQRFDPAAYRSDPERYLQHSRNLLPLLSGPRFGAVDDQRAAVHERFRGLLEKGMVPALGGSLGASDGTLREALDGSRRQLLRVLLGDEQRLSSIAFLASGSLVIGLCALLFGLGRAVREPLSSDAPGAWLSGELDHLLFENVPVPVALSDEADVVRAVNPAFLRLVGYEPEEFLGQELMERLANNDSEGQTAEMRAALEDAGRWDGEIWLRHKNGEAISSAVSRLVVPGDRAHSGGFLTVSSESVLSSQQQRLMIWQAHHDPLTKLPNRITLEDRFRRTLKAEDIQGLFVTIDIARFKNVNNSVGAHEADRILADAAIRLAMCTEDGDSLARLGGDTFALLGVADDPVDRANQFWQRVLESFRAPFEVNGKLLFLELNMGVAVFPRDGTQLAEMLQKADAARNDIKAQGGNGIGFFQPALNERAQRNFELQVGLRTAVENDELSLELQPIVRIAQGDYLGAEALLRWTHPTLGRISPVEFIPIAEETGLIEEIGLWVLREATQILEQLALGGNQSLRLSVNVSAVQLRTLASCDRLLDVIREAPAERLTIEITESALIDHSSNARHFLDSARQLGCQAALDDFGTGFSAMAYLRDFNFDVLKIDRAFIESIHSPRDLGLVASIVSMGKILGMRVVAEGIEEQSQIDQLNRIGCHFAQGYFYSKPLPVNDFLKLVSEPPVSKTA
ncbi:MAG: GGDEF domain-containing protein [Pseudomonadota bacterium]